MAVDDVVVKGMTTEEVGPLIRGPVGSTVKLEVGGPVLWTDDCQMLVSVSFLCSYPQANSFVEFFFACVRAHSFEPRAAESHNQVLSFKPDPPPLSKSLNLS